MASCGQGPPPEPKRFFRASAGQVRGARGLHTRGRELCCHPPGCPGRRCRLRRTSIERACERRRSPGGPCKATSLPLRTGEARSPGVGASPAGIRILPAPSGARTSGQITGVWYGRRFRGGLSPLWPSEAQVHPLVAPRRPPFSSSSHAARPRPHFTLRRAQRADHGWPPHLATAAQSRPKKPSGRPVNQQMLEISLARQGNRR
jgi:hypothetical protein